MNVKQFLFGEESVGQMDFTAVELSDILQCSIIFNALQQPFRHCDVVVGSYRNEQSVVSPVKERVKAQPIARVCAVCLIFSPIDNVACLNQFLAGNARNAALEIV